MKNSKPLKWIFKNTKPHILKLIILTVVSCMMSVLSVLFALVSKDVIDAATGANNKIFTDEVIKLVIFLVLQLAFQSFLAVMYNMTVGKIRMTLKTSLFKTILKKDWLSVNNYHTGELSTRLTSDINIISEAITDIVPSFLSLLTSIILGIVTLYKLEPTFALICLCVGPVIVIAARFYRKKFKALHKEFQETDGLTRSFMQDSLKSTLVIKSFQNENKIISLLNKLQFKNYKISIKRNNVSILANIMFYLSVNAGYYLAIAWGAYRISIGAITFGTLTAMLNLIGDAVTPFKSISSLFPKFYQALASSERIIEIEQLEDDTSPNETIKDFENFECININNVDFSYNDETEVLKDFSLTINKGDFVAINGRSGIGKSTLLKLMLGIIKPQKGILTANINNEEIILDKSTRGLFSYVPQGNMILTGTIKENIAFATDKIDDERIIESAKIAEIWDVIKDLPDGLDTKLGEDGMGLSEGQIQRLAIARAMYHNSKILLFDEATSALDKKTEMKILSNIRSLNDKTLIIVSHREEVLKFCSTNVNICVDKW